MPMKARLLNPICPVLKGCIVEIIKMKRDGKGQIWYETYNPLTRQIVDHLPKALEFVDADN